MSAGFGWSLGEVVLLIKTTRKVYKALNGTAGPQTEYQKESRLLTDLEATLIEVRSILQNVEPVFRNVVCGQLDSSTSSISQFQSRLSAKYGDALAREDSGSLTRGTLGKIKWAFTAAEELSQFRSQLSEQLDIVKLLMNMYVW